MPKGGTKLTQDQIAVLTDWIRMGAPWPQTAAAPMIAGKHITDDMRHWWSFLPLQEPAVPVVKDAELKGWAKTDIDRFVLAKLEAKDLKPSPMADKRTLIRRATLDLTGLPPEPADVEAFVEPAAPRRPMASAGVGTGWMSHAMATTTFVGSIREVVATCLWMVPGCIATG